MEYSINQGLLRRPTGIVDVVLDTDAYNEIDDQFAISYLLHAPERANVKAIYAAPFFNVKSAGPADGMEKSYQEICKLLKFMHRQETEGFVFRGSERYLPDEKTPIISPAAQHLAKLAAQYSPKKPLYVLGIAAITNIASALLMDPSIAKNIVIVWLGGHALHWPHTHEFNMMQDVAAARVVFASGAALVQLPCLGVVDQLRTTAPELRYWLQGKSELCAYLCDNTIAEADSYAKGKPWSRVIWDISVVAWLLDTERKWVQDKLIPTPIPQYDHHYSQDSSRSWMRYAYSINRDAVFEDMIKRLTTKA